MHLDPQTCTLRPKSSKENTVSVLVGDCSVVMKYEQQQSREGSRSESGSESDKLCANTRRNSPKIDMLSQKSADFSSAKVKTINA